MATTRSIWDMATVRGWYASATEWVDRSRTRLATGGIVLLAVAVGYHVVFGQNGLTVYERKREQAQVLAAQTEELRRENEALAGHVERLHQDPSAIEHQAREELHYTRPGEVIVALPPEPVAAEAKR